jgi:hypothetical protein
VDKPQLSQPASDTRISSQQQSSPTQTTNTRKKKRRHEATPPEKLEEGKRTSGQIKKFTFSPMAKKKPKKSKKRS